MLHIHTCISLNILHIKNVSNKRCETNETMFVAGLSIAHITRTSTECIECIQSIETIIVNNELEQMWKEVVVA
jgi:hypothetical protein